MRLLLESIPCDKRLHIIIGVFVFAAVNVVLISVEYHRFIALGVSLIAGIGIEIYQKITKSGMFEGRDILATFAGGLLGFLSNG